MRNQLTDPTTQRDTAGLRAVSPFVRFLEASFFTEIFRREALTPEASEVGEAEAASVPVEPPKVRRAAAGASND
jgi:hypothetical protein